jgi:hypothetical protein
MRKMGQKELEGWEGGRGEGNRAGKGRREMKERGRSG